MLSSFGTEKAYPIVARMANIVVGIGNSNEWGGGQVVKYDIAQSGKTPYTNFKNAPCPIFFVKSDEQSDLTKIPEARNAMHSKQAVEEARLLNGEDGEILLKNLSLRPVDQHDTVRLPDGYSIISCTRRPKSDFSKSWGVVAAISNSTRVPNKLREDLSGPNFTVQQVGNIAIYKTYLLLETSNWTGVLECDPCLALASSLAIAYAGGFEILIMGDLNGRTGSQTPSANDPPRI
ncbi:hypothetical protein B0H13DRAFT_1851136 [Mycena leptocephala]|nr:hypothetical protein B0H13DRAFT_1851136 [Mycena leptocephala]